MSGMPASSARLPIAPQLSAHKQSVGPMQDNEDSVIMEEPSDASGGMKFQAVD